MKSSLQVSLQYRRSGEPLEKQTDFDLGEGSPSIKVMLRERGREEVGVGGRPSVQGLVA